MNSFHPIQVSSKFTICGLPIRVDTYRGCSFGCVYCFSNYRRIMPTSKDFQKPNLEWVKKKLNRVMSGKYRDDNFLDVLIHDKITWHLGGMSDPFQPIEREVRQTQKLIDITNEFNISILFSTKSDTVYDVNINPKQHSFQISVTNIDNNKTIEKNVPLINKRHEFYKQLKNSGFRVGIRLQPFIPRISNEEIVEMFKDADYFSIEGLKLIPQNLEQIDYLCHLLKIKRSAFTQMGLLNLRPELREILYRPTLQKLEKYKIPYSLADNDLHHISSSKCCCGEQLVEKSTDFNDTALYHKNKNYTLSDLINSTGKYSNCKANFLFASNRTENCLTVKDFILKRFNRKSAPMSKHFKYNTDQLKFDYAFDNIELS